MDEQVKEFLLRSNSARHEEAFEMLDAMTPEQIARAAVGVHGQGPSGTSREALRDAALLVAETKLEERLTKATTRLTWVAIGLAIVQAIAAVIQLVK